MSTVPKVWNEKITSALRELRVNRVNAKSKIADACEYRDELKGKLDEMGPKKTDERLETANELATALATIDLQRKRFKALGTQMEKVIEIADKPASQQAEFGFAGEIKTDFTRKDLANMAAAEAEAKAQTVVPCIGGVYRFTKGDEADFQGEVTGGGSTICRVTVHSAKIGSYARDEQVEIPYREWKLEEIDVPKDALRVDQPKGGAAGEMGGKTEAA